MNYYSKYLKYKNKYLNLKGGMENLPFHDIKCSICLEDINVDQPSIVTNCDHLFHRECLTQYVTTSGCQRNGNCVCPICRTDINNLYPRQPQQPQLV